MATRIISTIPYLAMLVTLMVSGWLVDTIMDPPLLVSVSGATFAAWILVRPTLLAIAMLAILSRGFGLVEPGVLARRLYLDHFEAEGDWVPNMTLTLGVMGVCLVACISLVLHGGGWFEVPDLGLVVFWSIVGCMSGVVCVLIGDHLVRSRFSRAGPGVGGRPEP